MGSLTTLLAASSIAEQYGPLVGAGSLASGLIFLIARSLRSNDEQLKPAWEENSRLRRRVRRLERDRQTLIESMNTMGKEVPPEVLADDPNE